MPRLTLTDVAAAVGVHKSTVSRQARRANIVGADGKVDLDEYRALREGLDPGLQTTGPEAASVVPRQVLADASVAWDAEALQLACRQLGEQAGLKPKLLFQPLRVAVAGNMVSPPLFESIVLMDRSDVLGRIDNVTAAVFGEPR